MPHDSDIRRRRDGSIDTGHYLNECRNVRSAAAHGLFGIGRRHRQRHAASLRQQLTGIF
ncbi:hypothetical protein [Pseudoruegeria sp. HB172150]|uniref:hypothetical protein n=1 Tax=Pseudoruegeria sp. HB172150 TaxID=2721164 RepID=UPI001556DF0E|nr:hypothetical protein [Pseudoruegeria sp. HB172150]